MERVLVSGGRSFALVDEVSRILMALHSLRGISELGHGDAEGADTLCKLWALSMGIETKDYEVSKHEWDLYGGRAGNMRNSRMLREFKPSIGVVFPGGNGTADMFEKLIEAGIPTFKGSYIDTDRTALRWKAINGKNHG